ncbi:hypothetical protein Q73_15670 [Bacillus coahuilensis m2-6]|uniref:tRNA (adenosine(37)-N6)-threonylcarbamoyltransferase complex dimerization subunit type 1 TsaB n=1 Tax=Bacillus coahuilensis TaxID=408580 RepID=UPI0001850795|nr:tRNA (adenosine(37)-N6)-threonylcarbamoyltransferase complex dimerization subunit type 1 TsaB [Bacillus coahuilensis]KUP04318.1 hypothetical protein Q73_15670 [Bacillus coahuilensis m2-6]
MNILAIDTSNFALGVSLLTEEKVAGEYISNMKINHSLRAMPAVEQLLKDCQVSPKELDKIVVAIGPGSYTGVRIGVTLAKTLAWSLNIPVVGVSSLAVLAANGRYFQGYVSPLFDARRGQIYTGLYGFQDGELHAVMEDCNILAEEWAKHLKSLGKPVLFVGGDTVIHREVLERELGELAYIATLSESNPRPSELGYIGLTREPTPVHEFVPNYIRLAEAEAKWLEAEKSKG